jgi:hypothetical protein
VANSPEGGGEPAPGAVAPHRVDLARALAAGVVAALAAGDVRGARLAVGSLADLVEGCAAEPSDAHAAEGAPVVDLADERRRRER